MSTELGRSAEDAAAVYLKNHGYKIVERNFRTPLCEIDIVASKNTLLVFAEVKYRSHTAQGSGWDYITKRKLMQMTRAAELWRQTRDWPGEISLAAIEVGPDFTVTGFIESLVAD